MIPHDLILAKNIWIAPFFFVGELFLSKKLSFDWEKRMNEQAHIKWTALQKMGA